MTTIVEAPAPRRTVRLQRTRRRLPLTFHDLRELWAYHELMFFLIWRDVKVKYKQTALGAAWAILVPFTQMVVFTLLFNRALHVNSEYHVPYPLFVFTAMLPWTYFTACLSASSTSTSILVRRNVSTASSGVQQIGSFSLNEVFSSTGTPVRWPKARMRS